MRTHEQMIAEIAYRKAHGLPRIELTAEERAMQFGDATLAQKNKDQLRDAHLVERLKAGLYLSNDDKKRARRYMKGLE